MPANLARLWILAMALAACGGDDDGGAGEPDGGGEDQDAGPDPTDELFAPERLLEVEIEMAEADWDELRAQTRSILDVLGGGDCLAQPFESPFTYFPADITIDGERFAEVGLRKKGFIGSLSETKPSLKVKLDEYVDGQEILGLDKLTFNNSQQDPSFVRQCLAYDLFRAAGVPSPRCNFARVSLNGDDLGLFVHVESLDKEFLERNFDDPDGKFYEGTLSDFRPELDGTFELKTNDVVDDRAEIDAVTDALADPDDDQLLDRLAPLIDLDGFYTFWAMEVITRHWDGYASNTNNFYFYADPTTGLLQFVPWGVDGAFGPNPLLADPDAPPNSVFATGVLARRLYLHPTGQADYLARLRSLLDSVYDEEEILASIDRIDQVIWPVVGGAAYSEALEEVRTAVESQREAVESELEAGPPVWTEELRDPLCLDTIGTVDVDFETTWGTLGAADPFATGTGLWVASANGDDLVDTDVGATAGADASGRAIINTIAALEGGHLAVLYLQIEPSSYATGDVEVDWGPVFGALYDFNPATGAVVLVGVLGPGTVTLDAAGATAGAPVRGHISADLVALPF
jgi:spore coat protein H